jgi:hypothetical protein
MDLINLTPKTDEIVVKVKHPVTDEILKNDDGSEMTITLYANHSKEYKSVVHGIANKRIKKAKDTKSSDFTMEDLEEATLETLIKVTKGWSITYDGTSPKLTEAKAREVYEKVFWIKPQLELAMESSLDFMKA